MSAPIFARRHYCAVADTVASMSDLDESGRRYVAERLSELFSGDNERFDEHRFIRACGVDRELSERDRMEARGYRDGHAAGSWVVDGNTTDETCRRILQGIDEGDPEVLDELPLTPRVGGEWADEPTWSDILAEEGIEDTNDGRPELLDAYEYAFGCAAELQIVRACRHQLGLFPSDLRR